MPESADKLRYEIEQIIEKYDKVDLLSKVYFIASGNSNKQFHIINEVPGFQFLIGLALKNKNHSSAKIPLETIYSIIKKLEEYYESKSFFRKEHKILDSAENKDSIFSKSFASQMMQSSNILWQINLERYDFQHIDLIRGIFYQLKEILLNRFGFDINDLLNFGFMIYEFNNQEMRRNILKYIQIHNNQKLKEKKYVLKDFDFDSIRDIFVFNTDTFVKEFLIDEEKINSILDHVSCKFGDQYEKYTSTLDKNLFSTKPIIRISKKEFFCPQPNSLIFYMYHVLYNLFATKKDEKIYDWEQFNNARKNYLEERTSQYLSRLFPKECVIDNAEYSFNNKEYETDVLVAYDNRLLIFEAKAGIISDSARKGRIKNIEANLQKLLTESTKQAKRVRQYVLETKNPLFRNSKNQILGVNEDNKDLLKFHLINVTLEPLSSISTNLEKFNSLELFEDEVPWSVSIFDLDIITRLLDHSSLFIYYIEKRIANQKQGVFFSMDELTLFSIFLQFGTLHHSDNKINTMLILPDWTDIFDKFFLEKEEKPSYSNENFAIEIIDFLENSKDLYYTNTISLILDVSMKAGKEISKHVENMIKVVKKKNRLSDFSILFEDPVIGVTFMASKNDDELKEKLYTYCELKKYQTKSEQWIGMSWLVNYNHSVISQIVHINYQWEENQEFEEMTKSMPEVKDLDKLHRK